MEQTNIEGLTIYQPNEYIQLPGAELRKNGWSVFHEEMDYLIENALVYCTRDNTSGWILWEAEYPGKDFNAWYVLAMDECPKDCCES